MRLLLLILALLNLTQWGYYCELTWRMDALEKAQHSTVMEMEGDPGPEPIDPSRVQYEMAVWR